MLPDYKYKKSYIRDKTYSHGKRTFHSYINSFLYTEWNMGISLNF